MIAQKKRTKPTFLTLVFLLVTCFFLALSIGYANASIMDLVDVLTGQASRGMALIITQIRLPRIMACLLGGGSLALSGLLLQNLTKNPLADSGILGINAGAGLMVALVIGYSDLSDISTTALTPFLAMFGGAATIVLVYWISRKKNHGVNPTRLIIAGIGMSSLLSGLMVTIVSGIDDFKVDFIVSWLSGSISGASWPRILGFAPALLLLWVITYTRSQSLNIMNLNEQTALTLGLDLHKERVVVLFLSTALASLSVVLIGNITFIGLVAGHITRQLLGGDHHLTIPSSIILGMILLLVADTIGRVLLVGTGVPTGIIVTLIGAPYFLYLMTRVKL
ncbi:FecCD family ABC transporter permease [Streptococcus halotolerans]|uniref:FecCD family ABC transporter permease n=1 Tax=Streptococcus halotolerans TaxID=1814128 RepID=UPI000788C4D8|nr:iron ABC transporter permease [Streptococcus halotolerans]